MSIVNFKREINASVDEAIAKITQALQTEGFGILSRIDLHTKVKEKLGKEIDPVVILGACNPQLAYDAYIQNSDVTSLLPCNTVVRKLDGNRVSIEIAKPTVLMKILEDKVLIQLAERADIRLQKVLEKL
jgi:uncharacterized protein (DUF302 family)